MKIVPGAAGFAATAAGRPADAALALAIGNFDGVHLGHAALLAEARARAARRGGRAAVLTFTPHPARLFAPERAPPLIMSLERRLELCAEAGIDVAIVQPFTREFAAIDATPSCATCWRRELGARDVVVGYDFSFGRGRAGNAAMLGALGAGARHRRRRDPAGRDRRRALLVDAHPRAGRGGRCRRRRRSCSAVPSSWRVPSRAARGAGAGSDSRPPTSRPRGSSARRSASTRARARVLDGPLAGTVRAAALSVGTNPTFDSGAGDAVTVEAYLLDFEGDLYDCRLRVEVRERLRDERRFESIDALIAQIREDVAQVRQLSS